MMNSPRRLLSVIVAMVMVGTVAFSGVATASAAPKRKTLYINLGVYRARLGTKDSTAKGRVGLHLAKSGRDTSYEGQTVYKYCFGRKRTGGYDVEMYSNDSRVVWLFAIFGAGLKTTKGIHVGSTEASLKHAYGTSLKVKTADVYTMYTIGTKLHKGTDFYVRNSTDKITEIDIRNW